MSEALTVEESSRLWGEAHGPQEAGTSVCWLQGSEPGRHPRSSEREPSLPEPPDDPARSQVRRSRGAPHLQELRVGKEAHHSDPLGVGPAPRGVDGSGRPGGRLRAVPHGA